MRYFYFLTLLLATSACYTDFDPDTDTKPVLTINCSAQNDSIVTAQINRSWRHDESRPSPYAGIAEVSLTVNGKPQPDMTFDEVSQQFVSNYVARSGDKIQITAASQKYGVADGCVEVPYAVNIDTITTSHRVFVNHNSIIAGSDGNWGYMKYIEIKYNITFTDPDSERNFYMLEVINKPQILGDIIMDDPIFSEHQNVLDIILSNSDWINFFSDGSISGNKRTLTVRHTMPLPSANMPDDVYHDVVNIRLHSISESYYKYLLSICKKYSGFNGSLNDIGLGNDVMIYTNVSNGVGIVSGSACSNYPIDISDIIKSCANANL